MTLTLLYPHLDFPSDAWIVGAQNGDEATSLLSISAALSVPYPDTSVDTLPALTPAAVLGGGTTWDRTTLAWLGYTVQGSNVLSLVPESQLATLDGDIAVLCRITRHRVLDFQPMASAGGGGTSAFSWATKTADYTITTDDSGILVDATSGDVAITLPTAVGITQLFAVKRKDNTSHVVTVLTTSSQTIDGFTSADLPTAGQSYVFGSDNADWYVEAAYYPSPLTTLGDLIVADANALPQRLGVGIDLQVLTADSGATLGVDWETGGGGGGWRLMGTLSSYPATTSSSDGGLADGDRFVLNFASPVAGVLAVKVVGVPAGSQTFSSCSELQAYAGTAPGSGSAGNLCTGETMLYSRAGNISASFVDDDYTTYRVTFSGTTETSDYYEVMLSAATTVGSVAFGHGHVFSDGGWFDTSGGEPEVWVLT